jgi:hypothetical protein
MSDFPRHPYGSHAAALNAFDFWLAMGWALAGLVLATATAFWLAQAPTIISG